MSLKKELTSLATSQGADLVGVAPASVYADYIKEVSVRLQETGATGKDYTFSEDAMTVFESLSDVHQTFTSAKSIILLGVYSFDKDGNYRATRQKLQGKTARTYVYYPVVRQIAEKVAAALEEAGYQAVQGQQIPLKHAANDIGLGSYGWNGLLLTKDFGSYVALRAVITDAELEPDEFEAPLIPCEDCGLCLKACPTGALYAPYKVNPALCINPLTRTEDDIPAELRNKMGNWLCGCDICQEVCPVNRNLIARVPDPRARFDPAHHGSHRTLGGLTRTPDLKELMGNDSKHVMKRNAIIALGNIGTHQAMDILQHYRDMDTGNFSEYIEWATARIAKRTAGQSKQNGSD